MLLLPFSQKPKTEEVEAVPWKQSLLEKRNRLSHKIKLKSYWNWPFFYVKACIAKGFLDGTPKWAHGYVLEIFCYSFWIEQNRGRGRERILVVFLAASFLAKDHYKRRGRLWKKDGYHYLLTRPTNTKTMIPIYFDRKGWGNFLALAKSVFCL